MVCSFLSIFFCICLGEIPVISRYFVQNCATLEKPQSKLTNELTLEQLTFPPDTKFIDGITHVMYESIMGRNAFEKEYADPYKKPHYTEKSGVNKIMDDYILGKNDTHITTKDNESTYQQPSM